MTETLKKPQLDEISERVTASQRLSFEDGLALFHSNDLLRIGELANLVRERKNGRKTYFVVNRHINYSNICLNRCSFCAFSRDKGQAGAYEFDLDEILRKADEASKIGATEIHIVGGLHPDLDFNFYLEMISAIKKYHPEIHLQAFTVVEIAHLAKISNHSIKEVLNQLKEAGLGSLPGGGAEVFSDRVRQKLCPDKLPPAEWLNIMRQAHQLGLRSNATMLYGHLETYEERIEHLIKLRELQDETNGFMAFIPLPFHPANTPLINSDNGKNLTRTSAIDDLKTMAISRLMLDNFDHLKSFWIMLGVKLAQVSLNFGADDLDGTVVEEKITHSAGATTPESLTQDELINLIKESGWEPVERDTLYQVIGDR
ncbi:MAG: aminofutalosine synthase MqnE [Planctomycetes bacterium]|nr:aminofutalosine synthase MqnE [Planctomycetota bacterium]